MATIFSKIVAGEIPCFKVAEDDYFLAFLDISPLKLGHTLVIPKKEVDYIFDVDDDTLAAMMIFSKKVAIAMKKVIDCDKIGIIVIGLEVPHAHIHLVPIESVGDINFSREKLSFPREDMVEIAKRIAEQVVL